MTDDRVLVSVFTWQGVAPGAVHWHVAFYPRPKDKHVYETFKDIPSARNFVDEILEKYYNGWLVSYDCDEEYFENGDEE
jgi:hypothetical protein